MKAIKLTNKQITKLCEMCDKLFNHTLSIQEFQGFTYIEVEDTGKEIHWFEFCMTYLQNKLFCELNDFSGHLTADYSEECGEQWNNELMMRTSFFFHNPTRNEKNHPWHPIDYLYSEFKKLKL